MQCTNNIIKSSVFSFFKKKWVCLTTRFTRAFCVFFYLEKAFGKNI